MARRRLVQKRRRFFVGAEGESERAFATWLQRLCDQAENLHIHLDVCVAGGGDSLMVVEYAVDQYRDRSKLFGQYEAGLILLDTDRIEEDRARGRDPLAAASGERLRLVHLRLKLEGLLFRLYPGNERRFVPARSAERFLRGRWPTYDKPESADALGQRFTLGDLRRASQHDADLHWVLEILGLSHTER